METRFEPGRDADELVEEAVLLARRWTLEARELDRDDPAARQLRDLVDEPRAVDFTFAFADRVVRPADDRTAARHLARIVRSTSLPANLAARDRALLKLGAALALRVPRVVMPLARRRLRRSVGTLVVDASAGAVARHVERLEREGYGSNVNLLGEAVLGEREARRRLDALLALIDGGGIDHLSVKASAIAAQLNPWAVDDETTRVGSRLARLYRHAVDVSPPVFVNLDMEEHRDLDLTVQAFRTTLDRPELLGVSAGIALQAYLPETFGVLVELTEWATRRVERGGAPIKVRLVKGANLAMERVEATLHDWTQAPYETKGETDANFARCVDHALRPEHTPAVRVGVASHNLLHVAWALLVAEHRGVSDGVDIEMLEGMARGAASVVRRHSGRLLLYSPVVDPADFDTAIGYLVRRLDEATAPGNFLAAATHHDGFDRQADAFRKSVSERGSVGAEPRRGRPRDAPDRFDNQPDTDPSLVSRRSWAAATLATAPSTRTTPPMTTTAEVDDLVARAVAAAPRWAATPATRRRSVLRGVADALEARRGELVSTMAHEAGKPIGESDPEVSEVVDFARWYAERCLELDCVEGAEFTPLGVVAVVPPWNFPVAIPGGGVLAALAAGNAVVLKPSRATQRCAEVLAEACWEAGINRDLLVVASCPDGEVGRALITHPDIAGVVFTGSYETARMFQGWRPELRLFAETSGKNAMVITPSADMDLAVADLVRSAFGHGGQKCSAASLAICVGGVEEDPRFRRQLVDAVESLAVGPATDPANTMGPLTRPPEEPLASALTLLDAPERWMVTPRRWGSDDRGWTPGVKEGVRPGSSFHLTECFGPVLGVMAARDLDEAIAWQNATAFGLTGGIHSLDEDEIEQWLDRVEVGNAYVNRHTTGAIVRRQPFGGWKRSVIGPGAKAGGPDHLLQLGTWSTTGDRGWRADDDRWWAEQYGVERDDAGLWCERNVHRYRPRPGIIVRVLERAEPWQVDRVLDAARRCGVPSLRVCGPEMAHHEVVASALVTDARVRVVGGPDDEMRAVAGRAGVDLVDEAVTVSGRLELRHHLREQAISRTAHRMGRPI